MTKHFLVLVLLFASLSTQAKVLFEGYYKLEVKGAHRGYVVIQHSLDEKKNERTFSYYEFKKVNGEVSQSGVSTVSTADFKPLRYTSYEFGKYPVYTMGKFGNKGLEVKKYDGRSNKEIEKLPAMEVPPMSIFSSLVSQVQAKNVNDYKDGYHIAFNGLAEESARFDHGDFNVLRSKPVDNQMIFQVEVAFLNQPFEFYTFRNGEVAGTWSVIQDQLSYLVANRDEAVKDFGLQEEPLKKIFGTVPFGVTNNPVGQSNGQLNIKDVMSELHTAALKASPAK